MKKLFLPVGLVLALILALCLSGPGLFMKESGLIPVFVIVIFLVNGWEFSLREASINKRFLMAFLASALISLGLGPWLGALSARVFGLSPVMTVGLVVMATVPVTLSSAIVMAELCGGNRAWALLMTVGLNLCGILTVPFMLKLCLVEAGEVDISATRLLLQLVGLVLLPFLLGWSARARVRNWVSPPLLAYVPSSCVILTVYAGFSAAGETLLQMTWKEGGQVAFAAWAVHLTLMGLAWIAGRLMCLAIPERHTLLFIMSQKTMPLAVTVVALILQDAATALIPCLLFHFIQLFLDSFIAPRLPRNQVAAS